MTPKPSAGAKYKNPWEWLEKEYDAKYRLQRWKNALNGKGYCPVCHEKKQHPKDCNFWNKLDYKLVPKSGQDRASGGGNPSAQVALGVQPPGAAGPAPGSDAGGSTGDNQGRRAVPLVARCLSRNMIQTTSICGLVLMKVWIIRLDRRR